MNRSSLAVRFAVFLSAASAVAGAEPTAAQLWAEYTRAPDTHPNIPNCSYAGYRHGERPPPEPKVVADVRKEGAKGDGQADDTAAFAAAIAKAAKAGGGAVLVPAGTYAVSGVLRIHSDGVVLRGEGAGKSVIEFRKSLSDVLGSLRSGSVIQYGWCGGLLWIGPGDVFDASGKLIPETSETQTWEYWRGGPALASATAPARRGDKAITVDSAARIRPGDTVLMVWESPDDLSLLHHMAGHEKMRDYDWGKADGLRKRPRWDWPVEVAAVAGSTVTLKQPLRIDVRPEWKVRFEPLGPVVREAGVEKLTLRMPRNVRLHGKHLQYPGWNGIYLNRALHCWVRDVTVENVDNGLIHSAAKNTTVTGLKIAGRDCHHATALRVGSHDNLITRFEIQAKCFHGINTEYLSAGNVWSKGLMHHGTFDSHRAMSFEFLRTDIDVKANDGRPGGAGGAGPLLGARVVHWNCRVGGGGKEPGVWVNQPDCISMGALVGIQEPRWDKPSWAMVAGDKGCVIADPGKAPDPADLHEAQLKLRLGRK